MKSFRTQERKRPECGRHLYVVPQPFALTNAALRLVANSRGNFACAGPGASGWCG